MSFTTRFDPPTYDDEWDNDCECFDCPNGQVWRCYHAHRCLKEDYQ